MRLLLDTCTFLWLAIDAAELSSHARELVRDPANRVWLSSVSAWEIAVKHRLGRLPLPEPPARYLPRLREALGVEALDLGEDAVLYLDRLPDHHRDPFDRMLVCQALHGGLTLLTPDPLLARYPAATDW